MRHAKVISTHLPNRLFLILLAFFLLLATLSSGNNYASAQSTGFNAGRIIDDAVFFNSGSMDATQIQNFLNSKVPQCDTNGTGSISYTYNANPLRINDPNANDPVVTTSRAVYGDRIYQRDGDTRGSRTPYICINTKTFDTTDIPPDSGLCTGYSGRTAESSAQIIAKVAQSCGINPQVLLVLLQKEQSLVTDTWPWGIQYDRATGFSCPDPPPGQPLNCDHQYVGFFKQVYYAAWRFKTYAANPTSFNYRAGRNNYILYNPDTSCGGSDVFIQNQATVNLYIYTPYQPNDATLAAQRGQEVTCGAYGNINFWRLFNDWFGATTSDSNTDILSFIRLNHSSGHVEVLGLPSIGAYQYISRYDYSSYPAVPGDGAVIPLAKANGELSFVRLNHASGNVEIVTYSAAGGYTQLKNISLTSYPAVTPNSGVKPIFWPNGDLVFVRLNHASGNVEIVSYSADSNYKKIVNYKLTPYPAVPPDGSVVPLFKPNGDLSFIRLNHASGNTEIVTYSASSNYQQLLEIKNTAYPDVVPDGSVYPIITR